MTDLLQQHLDAVERMQADLEARIRAALGDVTPQDILDRADELPEEIAQELREWISLNLLEPLAQEATRFLEDIDEDKIEVDEQKVKDAVGLLLDHYITSVTVLATAAFGDIQNNASLQDNLGRSLEAIISDLSSETASLGMRLKSFENQLVAQTDAFVNSASGAVVIQSVEGDLTWIVVLDGRECDDCHPRHGLSQSLADWVEEGLPRTGWSRCGGRCRCILVPASAYAKGGSPGPIERRRR